MTLSRRPVSLCATSIYSLRLLSSLGRVTFSLHDRFLCTSPSSSASLVFQTASATLNSLLMYHLSSVACTCRSTASAHICWSLFSFLVLSSCVERIGCGCLLFSCVCACVSLAFFLYSFFFISSHTLLLRQHGNTTWFFRFVWFLFPSLFFYYFFLWISTRICCVEHVNDCTPVRRLT